MTNVGGLDRIMRFGVGVLLILFPFVPGLQGLVAGWGVWQYALTAAGVVMVGTAFFRFCPAYVLFGIRTCPLSRR
ncbi:transmembrane protein [Elstera litoralis]|uniref:Transmembrane protein n=1 Tax=Elstera litoralis TaxID=552518 RepID=A0A0F3IWH1_9PROT|nr:DUF2892 domain-containing protein [Elstera litoralis]KJV11070.1 transmembrane protein [Elstera litoralis]